MRSSAVFGPVRIAALASALAMLSACGMFGGGAKRDGVVTQAANIPASFDVTLLADKDNQFDFGGAPLTSQDLASAFRYRKEERLPMSTVLLKRGEKQKIKNEHLAGLLRIASQIGFKAYAEEKDGTINELQASGKLAEDNAAEKASNENGQ